MTGRQHSRFQIEPIRPEQPVDHAAELAKAIEHLIVYCEPDSCEHCREALAAYHRYVQSLQPDE